VEAFRTPGDPLVPVVGIVAVLWLLSHSTAAEVAAVTALLVLATTYFMLRTRHLRRVGL
jgi:hypothetical protein